MIPVRSYRYRPHILAFKLYLHNWEGCTDTSAVRYCSPHDAEQSAPTLRCFGGADNQGSRCGPVLRRGHGGKPALRSLSRVSLPTSASSSSGREDRLALTRESGRKTSFRREHDETQALNETLDGPPRRTITVIAIYQIMPVWKTYGYQYYYEPGEPPKKPKGQPNPKKNQVKSGMALEPLFPTANNFFVSWD